MADTVTPNYGWVQPQVGGDATTWGTTLNDDLALIDAQVYANEQATVMIGAVMMYAGAAAPSNWLLCQGQSLATTGAYAGLFAVIGYAFGGSGPNFNLPNLQQKFPLGAGPNPLGSAGGALAVTLAAANMPAHNHAVSDPGHTHVVAQSGHTHPDPGHTHGGSGSQDPHSHTVSGQPSAPGAGAAGGSGTGFTGTNATSSAQPNVYVNVAAAAAGLQAANANVSINAAPTGVTTQNAGSGAAFNIVPPFQAINFIIRYQ
jgi:microcystin-dependent protein